MITGGYASDRQARAPLTPERCRQLREEMIAARIVTPRNGAAPLLPPVSPQGPVLRLTDQDRELAARRCTHEYGGASGSGLEDFLRPSRRSHHR